MEAEFNYDVENSTSTILETERIVKIRKLNKKIGDNLKLLYGYRCQICGQLIGEEFILEKKIAIGYPAKEHKFDIVSSHNTMAIECKCYTWTETGKFCIVGSNIKSV